MSRQCVLWSLALIATLCSCPTWPGELTATENARFEACREKLKKAQQLDVLYDLQLESGRLSKVVVGPTFLNMPIDAKQGFADTVNCFVNAGRNQYINFDLLDWQTGKVVGRYSYGKVEVR